MTIHIELIHPKAKKLIDDLAALNIIKIKSSAASKPVHGILKFAGILSEKEANDMYEALNDTKNIDHEGW